MLITLQTVAGNRVVSLAVQDVQSAVREGEGFSDPMRKTGVFDALVVNMVAVGEESGDLNSVLETIADDYDEQVDQKVSTLMSLLEPVMIIGMGLVIGGIVIALFLPIIKWVMQLM